MQTNSFDLLRRRQVYPKQAALKKGSSIELCMDKFGCASAIKARFIAFDLHKFSENRIFTDADDYSMEIELPLADCPQSLTSLE